jgi:O-methyltransferase involved in polyketide biosynthesis
MADSPPHIDTSVPSPARIYDYWLGGKDNYEVDRMVSAQILSVLPQLPVLARANRQFLGRAVRHLAGEAGLRQFLDIGTGLPTADNTHQVAQQVAPDSKIVYVDNDPSVLAHARALLIGTPEGATSYVDADLRDVPAIIEGAGAVLDLNRPVGLVLLGVLEFIPDTAEALSTVGRLMSELPSGSHLVITHGVTGPAMDEAVRNWNASGGTPMVSRTEKEIAAFFDGLELLDPGLVPLAEWRPDPGVLGEATESTYLAGIGRKA